MRLKEPLILTEKSTYDNTKVTRKIKGKVLHRN